MKKSDKTARMRKGKAKNSKTVAPGLYECCWYEPSSDNPCCGGACGYGS